MRRVSHFRAGGGVLDKGFGRFGAYNGIKRDPVEDSIDMMLRKPQVA